MRLGKITITCGVKMLLTLATASYTAATYARLREAEKELRARERIPATRTVPPRGYRGSADAWMAALRDYLWNERGMRGTRPENYTLTAEEFDRLQRKARAIERSGQIERTHIHPLRQHPRDTEDLPPLRQVLPHERHVQRVAFRACDNGVQVLVRVRHCASRTAIPPKAEDLLPPLSVEELEEAVPLRKPHSYLS